MIKAIIFDFDGLLIDTETYVYQSFADMYEDYNLTFPKEDWTNSIGGKRSIDPYEGLRLKHPEISRIDFEAENEKRYKQLIKGKTSREGVLDYLIRAKELELKIAIASSSAREWIDEHMKQLDLIDYFDFICTSDDVQHVKPNPELYQKVLSHFSLEPNEAIVFEDSPNGSLAAINAKIPCVIVPNSITKSLTFDERVTLRLDSKKEMILDDVINKVEAAQK